MEAFDGLSKVFKRNTIEFNYSFKYGKILPLSRELQRPNYSNK